MAPTNLLSRSPVSPLPTELRQLDFFLVASCDFLSIHIYKTTGKLCIRLDLPGGEIKSLWFGEISVTILGNETNHQTKKVIFIWAGY